MSAATLAPAAAEHDLQELLAQYNGVLFTTPPIEDFAGFAGWFGFLDGRLIVLVPERQAPAVTVGNIREHLARTGRAA